MNKDQLPMMVAGKVFSGRYFATVVVISTYCIVILCSLLLVIKDKIEVQTFLGMMTGFGGLAQFICQSYFGRDDRKTNGGNGNGTDIVDKGSDKLGDPKV